VKRARAWTIVLLLLAPIVVLVGAGVRALWQAGSWWWLWWLLPLCWGVAYLLARRWHKDWLPSRAAEVEAPPYWTPTDRRAWQLVEAQEECVKTIPPERFTEARFYFDTALDMGLKIARHYHPQAKDPISELSVPEILAVAHLACEDMEQWTRDYVPGSHLLTVQQWRTLAQTPDWIRTAGDVYWAVSLLLDPTSIARLLASKFTMESATQQLQANVLAWFYVTFVRRVGFYAIEMNSGRLRGGAEHYRAMMAKLSEGVAARMVSGEEADSSVREPSGPPLEVTIAVVGQVKAGKSSLINALLGEQQAATDVLPLTRGVRRYRLELAESHDRLTLLDTPGYGGEGSPKEQKRDTRRALEDADLVLLVMNAANPANQADLQLVRDISSWFEDDVRRRPPPLLGVLTHVDLLTPATEWSPPYNWMQPSSPKERNIQAAVEHCRAAFGESLSGVVPVCADVERGRADGIREWLLPAMLSLLGDARACALLRSLFVDSDSRKVRRLVGQLCRVGAELLRSQLAAPAPPRDS
jgi:predicted GTPase